jgi:hypothetical protein
MAQKGSSCAQPPTRCRLASSATSSWRGHQLIIKGFRFTGVSAGACKQQILHRRETELVSDENDITLSKNEQCKIAAALMKLIPASINVPFLAEKQD